MQTSRDIYGPGQAKAIKDLLQSILISELLENSEVIWLNFAWISDLEIFDNTSRQFNSFFPDWPADNIHLSLILKTLLSRGTNIKLVIRKHGHNEFFTNRLKKLKDTFQSNIKWTIKENFHEKGLLGKDYFLSGSMNLTFSGVSINDEHIHFRTDKHSVAQAHINFADKWEKELL